MPGSLARPVFSTVPALLAGMRTEREKQELTLEWVADKVGVKFQSIQEFETGRKRPSPMTFRKWARALRLSDDLTEQYVTLRAAEEARKIIDGRLRLAPGMKREDADALSDRIYRNILDALRSTLG